MAKEVELTNIMNNLRVDIPISKLHFGSMSDKDFRFWTGLTRDNFAIEWELTEEKMWKVPIKGQPDAKEVNCKHTNKVNEGDLKDGSPGTLCSPTSGV